MVDAATGHVRIAGAGILGTSVAGGRVTLAARPESLRIADEGILAEITGAPNSSAWSSGCARGCGATEVSGPVQRRARCCPSPATGCI